VFLKEETHYCIELKTERQVNIDIGAQTNCSKWELSPDYDDSVVPAISGGARANSAGKSSEYLIKSLLEERGYKVRSRYTLPSKGIWNNDLIVDIFCQGIPRFRNGLIVESKWQDISGSAYQKIPYAIENIKERYPFETVLIIDGQYMSKGIGKNAVEWAKGKVGGKLIAVYTFSEFATWVIREL
jgi:hypothetical protein